MSNAYDLYRKYIGDPTAAAVGGFSRGMFGLEKPEYLQNELGREAYRTGQAVGNMPGVGMATGAVKAASQVPGMLEGITGATIVGARSADPVTQLMLAFAKVTQEKGRKPEDIQKVVPELIKEPGLPWMREIDDSKLKLKKDLSSIPESSLKYPKDPNYGFTGKLDEIMDHPELFKHYPFLKNYTFDFANLSNTDMMSLGRGGQHDPNLKAIEALSRTGQFNATDLKRTLLHEVQHAIQTFENWPRGNNPDNIKTGESAVKRAQELDKRLKRSVANYKNQDWSTVDPKIKENFEKDIKAMMAEKTIMEKVYANYPDTVAGRKSAYMDSFGERQSRIVETRMNMTPQQRKELPFGVAAQTQKLEDQIRHGYNSDFVTEQKPQYYKNDGWSRDFDTADYPFSRLLNDYDIGDTTK